MCSAPPPAGSGTVPPVESKCMRTRTSATVAALPNRTMCSTWNPTAPSSSRHWYVPCSCGPGGLRQRKLTLPPSLPPLSLSLSLSLSLPLPLWTRVCVYVVCMRFRVYSSETETGDAQAAERTATRRKQNVSSVVRRRLWVWVAGSRGRLRLHRWRPPHRQWLPFLVSTRRTLLSCR